MTRGRASLPCPSCSHTRARAHIGQHGDGRHDERQHERHRDCADVERAVAGADRVEEVEQQAGEHCHAGVRAHRDAQQRPQQPASPSHRITPRTPPCRLCSASSSLLRPAASTAAPLSHCSVETCCTSSAADHQPLIPWQQGFLRMLEQLTDVSTSCQQVPSQQIRACERRTGCPPGPPTYHSI